MTERSGECENQNRVGFHIIGMPVPLSLKTPGVMSTAELAARAKVGRSTVPKLVGHLGIREMTTNAKNHLVGRCHHPAVCGVIA